MRDGYPLQRAALVNAFTPEAKGWEKAGTGIIALATIAPA